MLLDVFSCMLKVKCNASRAAIAGHFDCAHARWSSLLIGMSIVTGVGGRDNQPRQNRENCPCRLCCCSYTVVVSCNREELEPPLPFPSARQAEAYN
jgi:hypothetical protein